jgi:hypothetical protein
MDGRQSGPRKGGQGMTTKKTVYRNSENGRLVTQQYARNHPSTTEKQHVYVPAPKTTTPKKK